MALPKPARAALVAGLVVALAGCATPYQPLGIQGGYRELRMGEDVFLVGFRWNRFTPPERIRDFLMLRAAEVALDHGAPYFMVLGQEKELRTDILHGTFATRAAPQPPPRRPPPSDPGQAATLGESQTMALRIRLVYEKSASGPPVMDAVKLRAELRAEYDLGP